MKHPSQILAIILFFLNYTIVNAQQGSITTGGMAIGSGGTLSYSIGQTDYLAFSSATGSLNMGMQQAWDAGGFEVPAIREVQNETIAMNDVVCYDATQTVILAGGGTYFILQDGGFAEIIAGQNILLLDGSTVESGGNLHAWITTDETYCGNMETMLASLEEETHTFLEILNSETHFFTIYPNPTSGIFTLEFFLEKEAASICVEIYSIQGTLVYKEDVTAFVQQKFSLENEQPGLYILRAIAGEETGVGKIILKQ